MSLHGSNTPPLTTPEAISPGNLMSNDDTLLSEITTYFVDCGFQPSLARNSRLEFRTNQEIMLESLMNASKWIQQFLLALKEMKSCIHPPR
ncbi:hypothetical protein Glove_718g43 [Diversispora epigaea]|uniref:Uncharacterized protein n=1 Tax=Diversispora epigaea TaxID=1348612 RepID=A0A397G3W7_9GLOM|nr:hypothetical protein Glove_718g43 [Diversispora epigaea]